MRAVRVHSDVERALASSAPVVALETAVVTHGLARPENFDAARMMQAAVRAGGATPATIGVLGGDLVIGLDDQELATLAQDEHAMKVSTRDLALAAVRRINAGTTVASTLHACSLATPRPIRVFATGGIGGIHRGWAQHPDISADLHVLAFTPVCVVCAGAKSILDLPATLECLESLGVPVIGFRTDAFPRFVCENDANLRVPLRLDSAQEVAAFCRAHWLDFGLGSGVVVAAAVDQSLAVPLAEFEAACEGAERDANAHGIDGPRRTPFLLKSIAERTGGRSVAANLALLERNASLAASIATAAVSIEDSA